MIGTGTCGRKPLLPKKDWGSGGLTSQLRCRGNFVIHVVADMIRLLLPFSLGLAFIAPGPAAAAVLAEDKVSNGYYWQKTASKSGSIRYICRPTSSGKFEKHQKYKDARAVKLK